MLYVKIFNVCVTLKTTKNVRIDKAFKCKAYHEQNIFLAIVEVYAYCKHTYFSAFTTIRFLANNPSSTWHAFKFHVLNAGALYIIYCITLFIDCNKKHAFQAH